MLYLCFWKRNDRAEQFLHLEVRPTYTMRTHIAFYTSSPILSADSKTFGGMAISEYSCEFDTSRGKFVESCTLTNEYEYWGVPTLLATISLDMSYWGDFCKVSSVDELLKLVESAISKYTDEDLSEFIDRDDFDDYIVLLHIAGDKIRQCIVEEVDLSHFNDVNVEVDF